MDQSEVQLTLPILELGTLVSEEALSLIDSLGHIPIEVLIKMLTPLSEMLKNPLLLHRMRIKLLDGSLSLFKELEDSIPYLKAMLLELLNS